MPHRLQDARGSVLPAKHDGQRWDGAPPLHSDFIGLATVPSHKQGWRVRKRMLPPLAAGQFAEAGCRRLNATVQISNAVYSPFHLGLKIPLGRHQPIGRRRHRHLQPCVRLDEPGTGSRSSAAFCSPLVGQTTQQGSAGRHAPGRHLSAELRRSVLPPVVRIFHLRAEWSRRPAQPDWKSKCRSCRCIVGKTEFSALWL